MARMRAIPLQTYVASDGSVASGYYIKTFTNDGAYTTLKDTYANTNENIIQPNPFILDAAGLPATADVYWDGIYDLKIYDGDPDNGGNLVRSVRNFGSNWSAIGTDLSQNKISNNSFEVDSNADGDPDNWTISEYTNGTVERSTADSTSGAASLKFIRTDANGAGRADCDRIEVSEMYKETISFSVKSSVANVRNYLVIRWLDDAQAYLSEDSLYDNNSTNSTGWERIDGLTATPAVGAKYAILRFDFAEASGASGTVYLDDVSSQPAEVPLSPSSPLGMVISNGTDASYDLDITKGSVRDATNVYNIIIPALTKQSDATWAEGSAAGAMAVGDAMVADEIYSIWAIHNPTSGASDILYAQGVSSFTSPTLPIGYTAKKLLQGFLTNSTSTIRAASWVGGYYRVGDPFNDVNDSTIVAGVFETVTLSVPPSSLAHIYARSYNATAQSAQGVTIRLAGAVDTANSESFYINGYDTTAGGSDLTVVAMVLVDSSSQIDYAGDETGGTQVVSIKLIGWLMLDR